MHSPPPAPLPPSCRLAATPLPPRSRLDHASITLRSRPAPAQLPPSSRVSLPSRSCPSCPAPPAPPHPPRPPQVRSVLLSRAHQRLGSRGSNRLRRFSRWLQAQPAFDYVVDGPNVGYANQNFEGGRFSFAQAPAAQLGRRGEGREGREGIASVEAGFARASGGGGGVHAAARGQARPPHPAGKVRARRGAQPHQLEPGGSGGSNSVAVVSRATSHSLEPC